MPHLRLQTQSYCPSRRPRPVYALTRITRTTRQPFSAQRVHGERCGCGKSEDDPCRSGGGNLTESAPNGTIPRSSVAVSAAERAAILAAWEALQASGQMVSRRAICRQVFNVATGGSAYRKVQAVLDDVTE
jgi:hypothetical protein